MVDSSRKAIQQPPTVVTNVRLVVFIGNKLNPFQGTSMIVSMHARESLLAVEMLLSMQ